MNLNKDENIITKSEFKNVAKGSIQETIVEQGFYVLTCQNDSDINHNIERNIESLAKKKDDSGFLNCVVIFTRLKVFVT